MKDQMVRVAKEFAADESGVGVVEMILILVENQRHPNLMCFV